MANKSYPPGEVANMLGITAQSVRRYCNRFFAKLDQGASPPKGQPRLLTDSDVYKLRMVNEWTGQGKTYEDIDGLLEVLIVPEDLPPAATERTELASAPTASDGLAILQTLQGTLQTIAGQDEQLARLTALTDKHTEELARLTEATQSNRLRVDAVWLAVAAFVAGLIVGLAVWWFQ